MSARHVPPDGQYNGDVGGRVLSWGARDCHPLSRQSLLTLLHLVTLQPIRKGQRFMGSGNLRPDFPVHLGLDPEVR